MDEGLVWRRRFYERVVSGGDVTKVSTDDQQQIRASDCRCQIGIDGDAGMADVTAMAIVDKVLTTERCCHRQIKPVGKRLNLVLCFFAPWPATDNHQWGFCVL